MASSRLTLWATVAGAIVGAAVGAGLIWSGTLTVPVRRDTSDARDEFLRAWERSRRATFVAEGQFTRRKPDGTTLTSPTLTVQRPPDRIVQRFGGVTGWVGGRSVLCNNATGPLRCGPGAEPAPDYGASVAEELDTFRTYFAPPAPGARPLYRVIRATDPGCFDLVQLVPYDDAPYGTDARLCFDDATGALRRVDRRFEGGIVESEEVRRLTADVRDRDFDVVTGAEGLPAADEPGGGPPETGAAPPVPPTTATAVAGAGAGVTG